MPPRAKYRDATATDRAEDAGLLPNVDSAAPLISLESSSPTPRTRASACPPAAIRASPRPCAGDRRRRSLIKGWCAVGPGALPWSAGPVEIGTRSVAAPSSRQLHLALAGILTRNLSLASDSASYCVTEVMANSEHDPAGQNPPRRTDEITSLEQ
jgi:hypothetical protein